MGDDFDLKGALAVYNVKLDAVMYCKYNNVDVCQ